MRNSWMRSQASNEATSHPTDYTEQSSQGTGFRIQTGVKDGIDQGNHEPKIPNQNKVVTEEGKLKIRDVEERRDEVENEQSREENWPHEERVDCYVNGIAVISSIEGKMLLKIEQSRPRHTQGQEKIESLNFPGEFSEENCKARKPNINSQTSLLCLHLLPLLFLSPKKPPPNDAAAIAPPFSLSL
ncbi:hypothetical protein K1719_034692 [Acacia pycnantha]|nr:hypothetical protein K1719_034692 [Acacia pycnantha]